MSIPRLRRWLIIGLTIAVVAFTVAVSVLVRRIFDNFGPGVASDLQWKTLRGAQELAAGVDLGLAMQDADAVKLAFGEYRKDEDVVAIVARSADGVDVASHGAVPAFEGGPFGGPPSTVRQVGDLLVAWAPAVIEGSPVGRVSLMVSTKRLVQSRALLRRLNLGTVLSGAVTWILGLAFVLFFTRNIAVRDAQLAEYASGLERKVSERTTELARINYGMRLVLDNVDQGFITIDLAGVMSPERSAICDRWFGPAQPGQSFMDVVALSDPGAAGWLRMGLAEIREDALPLDLLLSQLPARISVGARTLRLAYQPIHRPAAAAPGRETTPERLLVVLTDITDELARERFERDSRETIRMFEHIASDRHGFVQFLEEADGLVASLAQPGERGSAHALEVEHRAVHTLKGNAGIHGVDSMADLCHELESKLRDEGRAMSDEERRTLVAAWEHVHGLVAPFLRERRAAVELSEAEHRGLLAAIRAGTSREELLDMVTALSREPVSVRFQRLAEKAQYLARRLGKPPLVVHQMDNGVRLDAARWSSFWAAWVHALNNTIDHGIEPPAVRLAAGKPEGGRIWLEAQWAQEDLVLSIRDDGQGIDWERLAAKAAALGLPHETDEERMEALFAEGISSRDAATLTSGRGTGMGALREAARALGGDLRVTSRRGEGTVLSFQFPHAARMGFERAA
jgi:two-component system chemotaxis sensor kinase CheA